MRTQRHSGRVRRRFAVVVATAGALLASGGVAHAAPTLAPGPATITLDTPDIAAGGSITHTVRLNVPVKGRFTLFMEPGEGYRFWDIGTEAADLRRGPVDGGPNASCREEPYPNTERLVVCDVGAGESTLTYSLTATPDIEAWKVEAQASFQATGSTEKTQAMSVFSVLSDNPVEMSYRAFGRDTAGRLYSHQTFPVEFPPLQKFWRQDHGSGWNGFDALTKLSPIGMDNRGGGVAAREPSGLLWYYPTSGRKWTSAVFKPRVRVGTGWSIYTSVRGTGDVTRDGHADLIARDKAGVLWLYRGTGVESKPFAARTKVGSGWSIYNALTGGIDVSKDGIADLFARDRSGVLWLYRGTGDAARPYAPRIKVATGWNAYTAIIAPGDGSDIGKGALLVRDKAGALWWFRGTGSATSPLAQRSYAAADSYPYTAWR
ncbi:VCBS repeat-containing protein [Streptomyces sp. NBC_00210]|uniref:FG-GAP repeat domain-containing protein n=1 Tax=unclassified Streptomyces TaxID=2593676 RepID=UPI003252DB3A